MTITVYTKPECPQCAWTKRKLVQRHLTFTEIDVTQDADAAARLHSLGIKQLPYVVTDSDQWTGFRLEKIMGAVQ